MQRTLNLPEKLIPVHKPKRLKVLVGGRGSAKSWTAADFFLAYCDNGERLGAFREHLNQLEDSVHALLCSRIEDLELTGRVIPEASRIRSVRGGEIIYRGLSRNKEAIKSAFGFKRVWIEEGQTLSQSTLDILMPTIRENDSEIWITMNRGASNDAASQTLLKPYENVIKQQGFYEDDDVLIIQINYWENPWFPEVLEKQRARDYQNMDRAKYDHIWMGHYSDTVENAIILPEWFDACVDAHEKLGFKPEGAEVVSHDPSDTGDARALAHLHGTVLVNARQNEVDNVNDACDWALDYTLTAKADAFTWDGDGLGSALRQQINRALGPKKTDIEMFRGGAGVYNPDMIYEPIDGEIQKANKNKNLFLNARAQGYWMLRDLMYKTYRAIEDGVYTDPSELFSISSEIDCLDVLRSEIGQIPRVPNGAGKVQLMSKEKMKKEGINSPNLGDSVMMGVVMQYLLSFRRSLVHNRDNRNIVIPNQYTAFG